MTSLTIDRPLPTRLAGKHSTWLSVSLHLLPGILTGAIYYLLAEPVAQMGLPSLVSLMIAGCLGMVPFELGVIFWTARNHPDGPQPFMSVIENRQKLPTWQYIVLPLVIFLLTGLLFTLLKPATDFFQGAFRFLPDSMVMNLGQSGSYSRSTLIWVTILNALLVGIFLPITEEFYFRGFLLPRMPEGLKGWAPLAHSFLFAAYHLWSPWMIFSRTLFVLPQVIVVRKFRNLYVGLIPHCMVNLLDVVAMIGFITQL